jgi:hypothetical protein
MLVNFPFFHRLEIKAREQVFQTSMKGTKVTLHCSVLYVLARKYRNKKKEVIAPRATNYMFLKIGHHCFQPWWPRFVREAKWITPRLGCVENQWFTQFDKV